MRTYPKPFKIGNVYYIKFQRDNIRRQISTGCYKQAEAEKWVHEFIDTMNERKPKQTSTLSAQLKLYTDPFRNPRRMDKLYAGQSYSQQYAFGVARNAKDLLAIIPKNFLDMDLRAITRVNVKDLSIQIVSKFGHTCKATKMYKLLKIIFKQAIDDGFLETSPAVGLPDIKQETTREAVALQPEEIAFAIQHYELFPNRLTYLLFVIFASTGLRRSEALALVQSQMDGDTLCVNRAFKDASMKVVGLPKWNKIRTIALSKIAVAALKELFEMGQGRCPEFSSRMLRLWFEAVRSHVAVRDEIEYKEDWLVFTPHSLRHSLNTMLRIDGQPDLLVAEYMSWQHQEENKMQTRYTHLYAKNLVCIASAIDRLIGTELAPEEIEAP